MLLSSAMTVWTLASISLALVAPLGSLGGDDDALVEKLDWLRFSVPDGASPGSPSQYMDMLALCLRG